VNSVSMLLPLPRRICDRCLVCLLATLRNGPLNRLLNFGGDPNYCLDIGIVFQIRHYWEIVKWLTDIHSY